jgi:hypothetical protein
MTSEMGQKLTAHKVIQHVRLLADFGRDATLGLSPLGAMKRHLSLQYHRVTHSSSVIPRLVFRC